MSFLAVVWLGALGALIVPVALHLVSRGHQRRLRVGTVRLLRASTSFRVRRFRPSQLLLLFVRCLLLAALALALAEPRGWKSGAAEQGPGWVLVSPRLLVRGSSAVDDLAAEGHDVRLLSPGLPHAAPGKIPRAPSGQEGPVDVWSLVREADATAEAGRPFFVFADDRTSLRGRRPTLRRRVEWTSVDVAPVETPGREPIEPPLHAAVRFAPDREDDARYVIAALEASAEHLGLPLTVDAGPQPTEAPAPPWADARFIVWLSAQPVPESAFEASRVVLSDGLGRHASCPGHVLAGRWSLELRRCSEAEQVGVEAVLWSAGPARPLLTVSRANGALWYRLHGRFHPLWSDLVLGPALPEWLVGLLNRASPRPFLRTSSAPAVRAAARQASPRFDATTAAVGARLPSRAAESWLWGAVAILFALERVMALGSVPGRGRPG